MRTLAATGRAAVTALSLAALCLAALLAPASGQTWPSRPLSAIIPLAAGNAGDVLGRVVLDQLSRQFAQPIIIDNRPGGGGALGAAAGAKAAPDGYTMLVFGSNISIAPAIHRNLPYDTLRDFAAVIPIGNQPLVLLTGPSTGIKSVADLLAAAKAKPINYASAGAGSISHLAAERLRLAAGFEAQQIPFRGPVDAFTEVMTGRVDFYVVPIAPALSLIVEGKLRPLAVSTAARTSMLPAVPTLTESGIGDSEFYLWNGIFVPAGTPREIINRLHQETVQALQAPNVRDRLKTLGVEPMPMSPEDFAAFFAREVNGIAALVKAAKIVGD